MARGKKFTSSKMIILPKEKHPFSVPGNWFWSDIDSINQYSGFSIDPMKQPDTTFELYSVPSSAVDYPEIITGSKIGSAKQSVMKNDILLCKINPRINRVWKVFQHTDNELVASSEWIIIRNTTMNPDYLMFCFRTQYFREFMLSNVSGVGGSLMRAQPKFVKNYPIPIPPLAEQKRIVDRIERLFIKLDEAREKAQAVVDGFELRKSAILHKAFTGELTERWRKEHESKLDSWERVELADICKINPKKIDTTGLSDNLEVSFFPMPALSEIYGEITNPQTRPLKEVRTGFTNFSEGDVVFAKITPCMENGKSAVIGKLVNNIGFGTTEFYVFRCGPKLYNRYLYHLLRDKHFRDEAKAVMAGAVGQQRVPKSFLETYSLYLPPVSEQKEIAQMLDEMFVKEMKVSEISESILTQIDTMKKAILSRAFRGELGTNEPAEESAVELLKTVL